MILDTSAIVAIALEEAECDAFRAKIAAAPSVRIGAPSLVETGVVLATRAGEDAQQLLLQLLTGWDAVVIDFGSAHWRAALTAWQRFGRSRHPANLNFGDCLTYAVATIAGEPLLAKGGDFAKTDLVLA